MRAIRRKAVLEDEKTLAKGKGEEEGVAMMKMRQVGS